MQPDNAHPLALYSARVEAFLTDHFRRPISDLTPIAHGEWSRAFSFRLVDTGKTPYVARFSPLQEDFLKDRRAMDFARPNLPIPRILAVGEALDGYFAISERAAGDFLDTLDSSALRRLLPSLFSALDAARQVDLSAAQSGYGLWGAVGTAPHATWRAALLDAATDVPGKRTSGWRERLLTSPTGAGPFDEALDRLQSLVLACPEERHLIHSDLLNYNVLAAGDRVTAVLDWGSSMYGDFVFDVAWLSFFQPWYPAWSDIDFAAEAARHYASIGLDVPRFDERLRCYEIAIGLDDQAYCAFKGRWSQLEAVAQRTLELARR